jgi:HlyD family secretion protein
MRHTDLSSRAAIVVLAIVAACTQAPKPDAYGNIEVTPVVVSAQTSGQLLWFTPAEGDTLRANAVIAVVDTTQIALQRLQTEHQQAGNTAHVADVAEQVKSLEAQRDALRAQREALDVQKEIAQRDYDRTHRLFAQQAATAQQVDQADQTNRVLADQIKAQDQQIASETQQIDAMRAQQSTASRDVSYNVARVAQFADQIQKSKVINPIDGTVLTTYVKPGEFVQPGTPLYDIASLDTVELRAYVSEPQLSGIKLGGAAQLSVDVGNKARQTLPGTVDWISSEAEFTPTPIETQDERTNLVYAVKIRVANVGGLLKIGMPADVRFTQTTAAR